MSKKRISNPARRPHGSRSQSQSRITALKNHRFIGLDLGGGKNDRTSVAVLDYYPGQKKLFLVQVIEHIQQEEGVSGDQVLFDVIKEHSNKSLEYLCIDAPLRLPKCLECRLKCPGYERCREPEIKWMWKEYAKHKKKKPRAKLFTPYTQRAAEIYLAAEYGDGIHPMETLGANIAPLTARAHFLRRRLKGIRTLEVYPKLTVLRVGESVRVMKSHLSYYKHAIGGDESRTAILQALLKRDIVIIYQQDFAKLGENPDSFDAFMAAFTGFLKFHGQCEKPPKDFPKSEGWIEFPIKDPQLY